MAAGTKQNLSAVEREWPDEDIYKLIELYEDEELLYNTTDKEYHNLAERRAAANRIAAKFEQRTGAEVIRKWRVLLYEFQSYRKKLKLSKINGETEKIPSWEFYKPMSFIEKYSTDSQSSVKLVSSSNIPAESWNHAKIRRLIDLYKTESVLWNTRHPQYHKKSNRTAAFLRISEQLNVDRAELEKKLKCIRTYYARKLLKTNSSESTNDSKWTFFHRLNFLKDVIVPRRSKLIRNTVPNSEEMNVECVQQFGSIDKSVNLLASESATSSSHNDCDTGSLDLELTNEDSDYDAQVPPRITISAKESYDAETREMRQNRPTGDSDTIQATYKLLQKMVNGRFESTIEKLDDCTAFGTYIACELRRRNPQERKKLKTDLLSVICS